MQWIVALGVLTVVIVIAGWLFVLEILRQDQKYELYCQRTGQHMICRACGERSPVQAEIEHCPMCGEHLGGGTVAEQDAALVDRPETPPSH